jgi:hypothetical protein
VCAQSLVVTLGYLIVDPVGCRRGVACQAEEAAALHNNDDALHALDQAMTLFDYASPRTERAWTAFFSASRLGSMTVRAYSQLSHPETDTMARSLFSSLPPNGDQGTGHRAGRPGPQHRRARRL